MSIDRLTAEDRLMLWPDQVWPQDIGALALLDGSGLMDADGRFRIEAVIAAIEGKLHLVPRLRQRLHFPGRWRGGPLWVDAPAFDVADHVRVAPLQPPGDEAQLLLAIEQLRKLRMDRSRPLWEMWFLPGLPDRRIGVFMRTHHAVADGMAGVATLGALLDAAPDAPVVSARSWTPAALPSERDLFADNLRRHVYDLRRALSTLGHPVPSVRRAMAAWPTIHEMLAEKPGPRTSLDRLVGADRTFALIRSRLDLAKEIAHAHDAKVNDVLLTVIAGGLGALLNDRGETVEDVVPIYVPVSLHQQGGDAPGNLVSQMAVPLPVGVADPGRRLRQIAAETARRKVRSHPNLGIFFHGGVVGRVTSLAIKKLIKRQHVNVTSADLPGPPMPLYLAGARVLEVFPVLPLIGTVSLGVGALSYAGQFNIMAVADEDACPDIEVFAAGVRDDLRVLEEEVHTAVVA